MVERAADDLERGCLVALAPSDDASPAVLVSAVETLTDEALKQATAWSHEPPVLVLSQRRAAVLALNFIASTDENSNGTKPAIFALPSGVSADDISALADPTTPHAAGPYGHLPPATISYTVAQPALLLSRIANLMPAVLLFPLAVKPEKLAAWAGKNGLLYAEGAAVTRTPTLTMIRVARARLPIPICDQAYVSSFRSKNNRQEHYIIEINNPDPQKPVLTRIHSQCFTGDVLGSLRCDCGGQLKAALDTMVEAGSGLLLYMTQEGRGIGLASKLKTYQLQDHGFDTFAANHQLGYEDDERNFVAAAAMLDAFGVKQVRLITNNPRKISALVANGITVTQRVPLPPVPNPHNADYLKAKSHLGGHLF